MTTSNGAVDRTRVSSDESVAHRAVGGAFAGFFVDMFDVYLPIVALAPAAEYFQAKGVSASTASLLSAMVFVAALIGDQSARRSSATSATRWGDDVSRSFRSGDSVW